MAYTPYYTGGWQSGEEGGTPITPAALNHYDDYLETIYTQTETDAAIAQSTADKAQKIFFNVATWADVYSKLSSLGAGGTASILVGTAVVSMMTDGAVPSGGLTGFVGATNPNVGRYTFFATHYSCDFSCMWEINGLTSASATPTVINFKKIEPEYKAGTENFSNYAVGISGFITNGPKTITLFLDMPSNMDDITNISCTRLEGTIRGINGYINNVSSNTEWVGMSGITISPLKTYKNKLRINITSTSNFTNATNNTPVYFIGYCTFVMT